MVTSANPFRRLINSLAGKLIVAIGLIIIAGGAISWYMLISTGKKTLMNKALIYTASYSDLIKKSTHYGMLTFNRESIQQTINSVGSAENITRVRIFDSKGKTFYSSRHKEIGHMVDRSSPACIGCHINPDKPSITLKTENQWVIYTGRNGYRLLTFVDPIYNEPSCYTAACHVHPQEQRVLGVLETDFSLEYIDEIIKKQILEMTFFAVVFMGLSAVMLYFVLHRFVLKPISTLSKGMEKVSEGDLTIKLKAKDADEIGNLAAAFNKMVDDLQKATVSREYLEGLVKERTAELTASNEQLQLEIAEHMKAEEALKRAKEFSETVLNSMNDSISIIDVTNYKVVAGNSVYFKQLGAKEAEVLGRTCYEVTHHRTDPCQPPTDPCPLLDTMRTGEHTSYEHIHYQKDGTKFYEEVSTTPIRNEKGDITHVVHVARDITDRKRLEEQLRHSQRLEAVGHLAGGIAHDFNNILTAIIGYGNFLRRKMKEEDPLRTYVEQILASSERAANLTQSLLAFSRKQIINPRPVNLNDIVKRVEKLLNRLIGEDIELKTILADTDLTVMADSGQIEQVLMNLATNARDAMPEGGFLIVETKPVRIDETYAKGRLFAKPGMYAVLSVTDTGIGMDEETRSKIFEPFFTTKVVGKGTGLGLSIVYGIIKQHNGDIHVYSEPGRGTAFRIYLPLIKAEVEEERIKELPPLKGGTETILVAEDEADIRGIIREELEEYGYTVMEAEDGEDAIRLFTENKDKIQMAILDVIMPKKNGWEVHERIKKMNPDIKVIFMSGYTADIIHRKGIIDTELDFIPKPISPDDLLRKVREVLDR